LKKCTPKKILYYVTSYGEVGDNIPTDQRRA